MDTGINILTDSNGWFYTKNGFEKTKQVSLPYCGNSNDDIFFDNREVILLLDFLYDKFPSNFDAVTVHQVYFNKNSTMIIVPNLGD